VNQGPDLGLLLIVPSGRQDLNLRPLDPQGSPTQRAEQLKHAIRRSRRDHWELFRNVSDISGPIAAPDPLHISRLQNRSIEGAAAPAPTTRPSALGAEVLLVDGDPLTDLGAKRSPRPSRTTRPAGSASFPPSACRTPTDQLGQSSGQSDGSQNGPCHGQMTRTLSACGPFWPWLVSKDTRWPSSNDLNPLPWIAE
jgi:hypothetical protein